MILTSIIVILARLCTYANFKASNMHNIVSTLSKSDAYVRQ